MSDKKEIATLSIKISVDSTDLDKLEAQLKRIEGLMISTGLKQPAKGGFITDFVAFNHFGCLEPVFTNSTDRVFINGVFIDNTVLEKAMTQAAKEGAKKGAEQARLEITTGINDNREQVSAEMALKASTEISRTSEVISQEQSEFEKFKQQVESEFSQFQSSITAIQKTIADSDRAFTASLEHLRSDIQSAKSGWL
ncbi:hypothetical protein [Providencia rettgeri]|uniref:hypothetical protein n=1 Tax=Providencia rettgeri TaxID=587 RepID=UPI0018C6CCCC|nr:hypothetical protein [Providencia rettgeri]MBG5893260.1 hypothetical protein [Providencia rettgeri]